MNKSAAGRDGKTVKKKAPNSFKVGVCLRLSKDTTMKFTVKDVNKEMSVSAFKDRTEMTTGIPTHLQRIHYIDEGIYMTHYTM